MLSGFLPTNPSVIELSKATIARVLDCLTSTPLT